MSPDAQPAIEIEPLDEQRFLARAREGDATVEVRVFVDEAFLERTGLATVPGADIAEATIAYLLDHQRLDELPPQLELEDVAAAYDDFEVLLRRTISRG